MTENRDQYGNYRNPLRPNAGPYISVTTAISRGIPKNLDNWHKKLVAEYAVDHLDAWQQLDRDAAVDLIKRASDRKRDAAANRGTIVHQVMEARASGVTPDPLLHADVIGYVNAGLKFFADWQPDVVWSEVEVFSDRYRYAGTLDLIVHLPGLGVNLADWKTSKAIYPEVGLQLAAYRNADYAVINGAEVAIPDVVGGFGIRLAADGIYELVPVDCGDDEFGSFLNALEIARWRSNNRKVVGTPVSRPADALAARAEWLKLRVAAIRDAHPEEDFGLQVVASMWPAGVPTLREGGHTPQQLDLVADCIARAEAHLQMPFPPADPNSERLNRAEVEPIAARLRALPADLVDAINETGRTMNVPPLLSGRLTRGQLDDIIALVDDAEQVAADRVAQTADIVLAITGGDEALMAALLDACGAGGGWTDAAMKTLDAIHVHVEKGVLVFDDGVLCTVNAEGHLVDWFGNKREALAAIRNVCEAFGFAKPRSVADAAGNPTLVALAGASVAA